MTENPPLYNEEQLKELIELATRLEFHDDVARWKKMLADLRASK